ncbi:hypothetical protein [Aeromicrobium ginsengisoli]|uniref:Uncharacterized protein n=1 Tax=Aeromicrobium ginsengisoli TaxID=363867 RepID=A0A5M4FI73_9ACTN|nr:hypothetical protein [Aeromicrobium ginsengisoli]KAA1399662.1 hypothetical protein ESP70_002555 [Aeromicrobium ginsengisoli]
MTEDCTPDQQDMTEAIPARRPVLEARHGDTTHWFSSLEDFIATFGLGEHHDVEVDAVFAVDESDFRWMHAANAKAFLRGHAAPFTHDEIVLRVQAFHDAVVAQR